eukprot:563793_1
MDDERPMQHLNEYTLFLLLEKQRNIKLRELYHDSGFATPKKSEQSYEVDATLPKFPPRYMCLRHSVRGLLFDISRQRRDRSLHGSTKEQWK